MGAGSWVTLPPCGALWTRRSGQTGQGPTASPSPRQIALGDGKKTAKRSLGFCPRRVLGGRIENPKHSFVEDVGSLDVAQVRRLGGDVKAGRGDYPRQTGE